MTFDFKIFLKSAKLLANGWSRFGQTAAGRPPRQMEVVTVNEVRIVHRQIISNKMLIITNLIHKEKSQTNLKNNYNRTDMTVL